MVCPTKVAGVVAVFLRNFTGKKKKKKVKLGELVLLTAFNKPVYLLIVEAAVFTHHSSGRLQPSEQPQTPSDLRRQREKLNFSFSWGSM